MRNIKKPGRKIYIPLLAFTFILAGCTPSGPRALLRGEQLLNEGRGAEAIAPLKEAVTLLNTNAAAWNYLGVAYHETGDLTNAAQAYQQALKLNRDLVETHFNLGCLWLEENRLDNAKSEFSAFVLRRANSTAGWLKLGSAQLRSHELPAAEKSFNEALHCSAQNPEAWNGLGLVQIQRNRAYEAAQSFNAALQQQPDYAPALLNLAIVSQSSLNNRPLALQKYREYLALPNRPANWEAVHALAAALEQELKGGSRTVLAAVPPANIPPARTPSNFIARVSPPSNQETIPPAVHTASPPASTVVKVNSQPEARMARDVSTQAAGTSPVREEWNEPATPSKPGFFQKLFHHNSSGASKTSASANAPTLTSGQAGVVSEPIADNAAAPPIMVNVARYKYHSLPKPAPGNRLAAEKFFLQGLQSQRAGDLPAAMQAYNHAVAIDPAYFEAYYNLGLASASAGDVPQALSADEYALTIRPDSAEARLNFAQLLKQVNFFFDAANELATVLAKNPDEVRAHLALGNLYAQQFHQNNQAREHYLKVLALDSRNPQAPAIRDWLVAHPR